MQDTRQPGSPATPPNHPGPARNDKSMLDRLNRFARWLLPVRNLFLALAIFAFLLLLLGLFVEKGGEHGMIVIPSLTLFLWALSVHVFILNFAVVPPRPDPGEGLLRRSWQGIKRAWYWFVALFFLLTTAVGVYLTIRLLGLWLRDFY